MSYRYCSLCDEWFSRRTVACPKCGSDTEKGIGPVEGVRKHICGLSGIGFQCPACEAKLRGGEAAHA